MNLTFYNILKMDNKQKDCKEEDNCTLIIVGDSTVGKTSILLQYKESQFYQNMTATIGVDYVVRTDKIDNEPVKIKIWDTAGQERFQAQTASFFKNTEGVILVFDVTNMETFENLKHWIHLINSNCKNKLKRIIIGNKIDLKREVSKDEAMTFAKENNIPYFEVSAKNNTNIHESIRYIAKDVVTSEEHKMNQQLKSKQLNNQTKSNNHEENKGCCK